MFMQRIFVTFLGVMVVACSVSCKRLSESTTDRQEESTTDTTAVNNEPEILDDSPEKKDRLEGVLFPKAAVRHKIESRYGGVSQGQGLHFEESIREEGGSIENHFGKSYCLSWTYLGSSETSDNYRFSISLPDDPDTFVTKDVSYSGEDSMLVFHSKDFAVKIDRSIDYKGDEKRPLNGR